MTERARLDGQFSAAVLALTGQVEGLAGIGPLYDSIHPLLGAVPEIYQVASIPSMATGAIKLCHVTFRYSARLPPMPNDINLAIRSGEFLAVVGMPGSSSRP